MTLAVFGITLGKHSSMAEIFKVVAKRYKIHRGEVEIEQVSDFTQVIATCKTGDTVEIELYC